LKSAATNQDSPFVQPKQQNQRISPKELPPRFPYSSQPKMERATAEASKQQNHHFVLQTAPLRNIGDDTTAQANNKTQGETILQSKLQRNIGVDDQDAKPMNNNPRPLA
jgi:hypothetical protein